MNEQVSKFPSALWGVERVESFSSTGESTETVGGGFA
jgi:hypothetical protein